MRIGVDMDGTVVDFPSASFEKVYKLYGIKLEEKDVQRPDTAQLVWEKMSEGQKAGYDSPRDLYKEICDQGFFTSLKPYPNAIEAVTELHKAGHNIVWITKVLNWTYCAWEKVAWLTYYFPHIPYSKIFVDQSHAKGLVNVDVIIDDDHRALESVNGPSKILMRRPWNLAHRDDYLLQVNDMTEATKLVLSMQEHEEWWERKEAEHEIKTH